MVWSCEGNFNNFLGNSSWNSIGCYKFWKSPMLLFTSLFINFQHFTESNLGKYVENLRKRFLLIAGSHTQKHNLPFKSQPVQWYCKIIFIIRVIKLCTEMFTRFWHLCLQFYNWIGANLQIHKDTTVLRDIFVQCRKLALKRSRMLENYPGHHRPRITLQIAAKIWEITFNCWGVYFKLAFPVPFGRQL